MICRRVLVIHDGRIVADDHPENLSERLQHTERIELTVRGAQPREIIGDMRELSMVVDARRDNRAEVMARSEREGTNSIIVDARPNMRATEIIANKVIERGWGLVNLTPLPLTLEEIFLELTTEEETA